MGNKASNSNFSEKKNLLVFARTVLAVPSAEANDI